MYYNSRLKQSIVTKNKINLFLFEVKHEGPTNIN